MISNLHKIERKINVLNSIYEDKSPSYRLKVLHKNLNLSLKECGVILKESSSTNPDYTYFYENLEKKFKKNSYKNIRDIIFNYLNGWIIEEDIFWVFYVDSGDDIFLDPTDGPDKLTIVYLLTQKIQSIFPISEDEAFEISNDFIDFKLNEEKTTRLVEQNQKKINPPVQPGDYIRVIEIDHDMFPPSEYEQNYMPPEHLELGEVQEVYQEENPIDGSEVTMLRVYFPNLEFDSEDVMGGGGLEGGYDDGVRVLVLPYDTYIKTDEVLTEHGIIGDNKPNRPRIPDILRKNLIRARFERPGGWGRNSELFILYLTPVGKIMDIQFGSTTNASVSPFQINQQVSFGDLYKFEQDSPFDLRMFGRLREQDEQMSLFPTGDWEFTVGFEDYALENGEMIAGSDQDTADWIRKTAPERLVAKIFKMWDAGGIDFSNLKLLGLPTNSALITFLLKRYIRNTKKPIPVSYTFDCDDLSDLFDKDSRDYNLDYIKQYLCGDDSFWDTDLWYGNEWSDYMSDDIDETNWKIISEIFGGASPSDAEDILNRSSSSEEVDELIEKYDEEIDDIRNFVTQSHDTAMEDATKSAMANDIKEKILDHFGGGSQHDGKIQGKLFRNDNGKFNYVIEGDLRDLVNEVWDNTEDVFQFHPDYSNTTLEDALMEMDGRTMVSYDLDQHLFRLLMEEEFKFWDYCEGRLGDCLEVDTKFFDGYWHPSYDINEYLIDRLYELIPGPIQEQTERYLQKKGDQLTRKVVKDILHILKTEKVLDDLYILPDHVSGVDGDEYTRGDLEFNVTLHILQNPNQDRAFMVDANMGGDFDDEIEVIISLGPKFGQGDYEQVQGFLNDYVRHEIEHVIDALEGNEVETPQGLSPFEYYTQPHEVRAQKAGFKRRAKIEKRPVEDIVKDYIEYRQSIDKLTDDEKNALVTQLTEQEKKSRFKTIYENDNWKYVWPIGDESFCEIAKGTKWCGEWTKDQNWYQSIGSSGTHYILIDKKTGEKYSLVDQEKVPGMPSYKVRIYDKDREFLSTHRFLADKPTLHELFNQSYTMLDKLRYNVEIPKEDLDNFYKETIEQDVYGRGEGHESAKLLELVYKIIKDPTFEGLKQQLEENYNGGLTVLTEGDVPVINSMIAGKQFLSIYLPDEDFKSEWMNIGDDDDYYFDLAVDRYYSEDHCEEMEEDEIAYIGSYMNKENIKKLNNLSEIIGEPIGDWRQESEIDEYLTKYFTKDWNDYIWRIVEQIGCAVGRNRVKDIRKLVKEGLLLDVDYVGARNYAMWRIDITYPELLYLVGIYGVDNIKQLEDHSINDLDVNLYDAWWDSWSLEGGEEDINWEMGRFLDNVMEEYGDDLKTLGENEEKFMETINNLGFTKPYREWQLKQDVEGSSYQRSIIIKDWDLKSGKIHIQIQENDEQGRWQTKQHQTTIDELPTYVNQHQLF